MTRHEPHLDTGRAPVVDALIFAGGTGARMGGSKVPKQFLRVGGKEVILWTLDRFARHPLVSAVTVVCLEGWVGWLEGLVAREGYPTPVHVIPGAPTGQGSRLAGIDAIHGLRGDDPDAVTLVHDGVRPLVDEGTITACIGSVGCRGCTATVAPAIETIVLVGEGGRVEGLEDRSRCRLARAPQGFRTFELWRRYRQAASEGLDFIDSISLMAHYGHEIYTVDGPAENIKVTTPADYFTLKGLMDMRDLSQLWGGGPGDE